MKNRCPSEQNTRVVRINVGDYLLLRELSQRAGITMAEAFHLALESQDHKPLVEKTQLRMPITMARSTPVTMARSMPVTISFLREVENVNGHKQTD